MKIKPITPTVPRSALQLILYMVRPYRLRTFFFFFLTFLGIVAWSGSPVVISNIVTRLGQRPEIDAFVWWMAALYFILRVIDEVMWRISEVLMRT